MTTMMAEPAGIWVRVSTGGQDEANQVPDIGKHCAARGYAVKRAYTVHGKSASKGRHQGDLDAMLADMRAGVIRVLVIWHSDRIERRPGKALLDLLAEVSEAGGRVESVKEPTLGQLDFGSQVTTFIAGLVNHEKSRHLGEQVTAGHDRSRANGALTGKYTWGYTSTGPKYRRRMVATAEGEQYAPEAFTRIADGGKLPAVAAWLSEHTHRNWHPWVLARMIRNPAYMGRHTDMGGRLICTCPALVDGDLWRRANASLDARPAGRRGQRNDLTAGAALLSGPAYCLNPECTAGPDSPMYKTKSGYLPVYRCSGRGAQRKGCGAMVPLADADDLMNKIMSGMRRPVLRPVFHPAEGHQTRIDDIAQALRDLPAQGLSDEDEDAERARLRAARRELAGLPAKAAWTEWVPTGETYGDKWQRSDAGERRAWLKDAGFAVYLGRPDMGVEDDEHDEDDLSRVDVYESDRAVLVFRWTGDEDAGLARGLPVSNP